MGGKLTELEERRKRVGKRLTEVGAMRQGSLYERYLKCGKLGCRCSTEASYSHGPYLSLTKTVKGKTVLRKIPKDAVESTREHISNFHEFRLLSQEFLEVNEEICDAKLTPEDRADVAQKKTLKKSSKPKL